MHDNASSTTLYNCRRTKCVYISSTLQTVLYSCAWLWAEDFIRAWHLVRLYLAICNLNQYSSVRNHYMFPRTTCFRNLSKHTSLPQLVFIWEKGGFHFSFFKKLFAFYLTEQSFYSKKAVFKRNDGNAFGLHISYSTIVSKLRFHHWGKSLIDP